MRIKVLHAYYGCETGCCGHVVEIDGDEIDGSFEFGHPDDVEELRSYILNHVPKECHDSIDWDSIEVESMDWC